MRGYLFSIAVILLTVLNGLAQNSGAIRGKVTYGQDLPLHDASVSIVQTRQSTRTNENGAFRLTDVPNGRYTVLVHQEGFADATKIITVTAGSEIQLDFQLQIASLREEVTVTARVAAVCLRIIPVVNSVGSTQITERASTSLGDVLANEPGIAKRSFGPGSSRPVIHGMDGDRVLIAQDGVRTGSLGSQSGDHGEPIDPISAERIEVLKGPGTLLYGSNAIGGVVNVISNDENAAHEGFRGSVSGVAGSADRQAGIRLKLAYGSTGRATRNGGSGQRTGDFAPLADSEFRSRSNSGSFGGTAIMAARPGSTHFERISPVRNPFAALFEGGGEEEERRLEGRCPKSMKRSTSACGVTSTASMAASRADHSFLSGFSTTSITDYDTRRSSGRGIDTVGTIFDNKTFSYALCSSSRNRSGDGGSVEGFSRDTR